VELEEIPGELFPQDKVEGHTQFFIQFTYN
jgi:hypothetical protein